MKNPLILCSLLMSFCIDAFSLPRHSLITTSPYHIVPYHNISYNTILYHITSYHDITDDFFLSFMSGLGLCTVICHSYFGHAFQDHPSATHREIAHCVRVRQGVRYSYIPCCYGASEAVLLAGTVRHII